MGVLLAFNGAERQTMEDLLVVTKLSARELVKQAQSLVEAKLIQTEVIVRLVQNLQSFIVTEGLSSTLYCIPGLVFTNILTLRIVLFLEFS